jgi:hypothetical protein
VKIRGGVSCFLRSYGVAHLRKGLRKIGGRGSGVLTFRKIKNIFKKSAPFAGFRLDIADHALRLPYCVRFPCVHASLLPRRSGWAYSSLCFSHFVTSTTVRLLPAGAVAGWGSHPLESAAFAGRTPTEVSGLSGAAPDGREGTHRRDRGLYHQGIPTRSADDLVRSIGMSGVSKTQVSRLCEEIHDITAFLDRPIEGDWPYLWIDATHLKVRQNGRLSRSPPSSPWASTIMDGGKFSAWTLAPPRPRHSGPRCCASRGTRATRHQAGGLRCHEGIKAGNRRC